MKLNHIGTLCIGVLYATYAERNLHKHYRNGWKNNEKQYTHRDSLSPSSHYVAPLAIRLVNSRLVNYTLKPWTVEREMATTALYRPSPYAVVRRRVWPIGFQSSE